MFGCATVARQIALQTRPYLADFPLPSLASVGFVPDPTQDETNPTFEFH